MFKDKVISFEALRWRFHRESKSQRPQRELQAKQLHVSRQQWRVLKQIKACTIEAQRQRWLPRGRLSPPQTCFRLLFGRERGMI